MTTQQHYVAPQRGCLYEEEPVLYELFSVARILDLRSPRLAYLVTEDKLDLIETTEPDELHGPLIVQIPRKYLIEVQPSRYPMPTPEQLAIPAPTPTWEDRLRLYRRSGHT